MRLASLDTEMRVLMRSAVVTLFCLPTVPIQAEVRVDRRAESFIEITISGEITESDAKTFASLSRDLEYKIAFVDLDGVGGSVFSAMQIGRLARKYDVTARVNEHAKCYSSCVLIFIAGVERQGFGQIGLHRPYFAAAPQSREAIENQVPLMLSALKKYSTEMGVTDNFYQQMVNTEPSKVAIYNGKDIQILVPVLDPTYEEIQIAYQARRYGVTTSEMRLRLQEMRNCTMADSVNCIGAATWGLSPRVYVERAKKVRRECWFAENKMESEEDVAALFAVPRKAREDHPITIRRETCERDIMLGR
jgi:hypothetical protein